MRNPFLETEFLLTFYLPGKVPFLQYQPEVEALGPPKRRVSAKNS
jgi:hypothetical protein